jgi:hypothetical protein
MRGAPPRDAEGGYLCETGHKSPWAPGTTAVAASNRSQWQSEPKIHCASSVEADVAEAKGGDTGSSDDSAEVSALEQAASGLSLDGDDASNRAPLSEGPGLARARQNSSSSLQSLGSAGSACSSPRAGQHARRNYGPGLRGCRIGTCVMIGRCICDNSDN